MSVVPYPKALAAHPTLRQSLLSNFDSCALTTKFGLAHERGWSTHPQARGQIMHHVFAKCLRTMHEQRTETIEVDVALAILAECLRQADVPDREVVNIPAKEIKDMRWVTIKWAHDNSFSIANLVDVEFPLEVVVHYPNPSGGFVERRLTGRLDALFLEEGNESAVVIDWKDTWALPPATQVSFTGYFQQRAYGLLLMKRYPQVQRVTLREFYVRHSEVREVMIGRNHLAELEQELSALAERFDRCYETDTWPPSPGAHCGWCSRPTACPIFPSARLEGSISSQEEAERIAAELVVAKAVAKQRGEALKAWANSHGPVAIKAAKSDRVLGFKVTKRTKRPDRDQMAEALRTGQVDLDAMYAQETHTRFEEHNRAEVLPHEADDDLLAALQEAVARKQE